MGAPGDLSPGSDAVLASTAVADAAIATPGGARSEGLRRAIRGSLLLGGSSAGTLLVALASNKAWALLAGPVGVGYLNLVSNLVTLLILIAGVGLGTGVVRLGAAAAAANDEARVASLQRAAWAITAVTSAATLVILLALRGPVSGVMLGSTERQWAVVAAGAAMLLGLAGTLELGFLNMRREVSALARAGFLTSVASATLSIIVASTLGARGAPVAVICSMSMVWLVTLVVSRRAVRPPAWRGARPDRATVRELLDFGAPYTLSLLVSTGVQLLLPVVVLHALGSVSVGHYAAGAMLSSAYLSLVLTAMARDYYPHVSAVRADPVALREAVDAQQQLVLLIGGPLIIGCLAVAPLLVRLVFSAAFLPAVPLVEWQLVGDVFKFTSFTLAFVILALAPSSTYLRTEALAGGVLLGTSVLGVRWLGLPGLGLAYLATYATYFAVVYATVRRRFGISIGRPVVARLVGLAAGALAIVGAGYFVGGVARHVIAGVITGAVVVDSGIRVWRMFRHR